MPPADPATAGSLAAPTTGSAAGGSTPVPTVAAGTASAAPAGTPSTSRAPSPAPSQTGGPQPVRDLQVTDGGFVMGECTGSRITEYAAEPKDGWSAIAASPEPSGIRTGLQRPGQRIVVHLACVSGRPAFTVEVQNG